MKVKLEHLRNVTEGFQKYLEVQVIAFKTFYSLIRKILDRGKELSKIIEESLPSEEPPFTLSYGYGESFIVEHFEKQVKFYISNLANKVFKRERKQCYPWNLPECLSAVNVNGNNVVDKYFKPLLSFLDLNFPKDLLKILNAYTSTEELRKIMLFHGFLYLEKALKGDYSKCVICIKGLNRLQYLPPILTYLCFQDYSKYFSIHLRSLSNLEYEFWKKLHDICSKKEQRFNNVWKILRDSIDVSSQEMLLKLSEDLLKAMNLKQLISQETKEGVANFLDMLKSVYKCIKETGILTGKREILPNTYIESITSNVLEFNLSMLLTLYGILPLTNAHLSCPDGEQEEEIDVFTNLPLPSGNSIYYKSVFFECKLREYGKVDLRTIRRKAGKISYHFGDKGFLVVLCDLGDNLYELRQEENTVFINVSALTMPEVFLGLLYYSSDLLGTLTPVFPKL